MNGRDLPWVGEKDAYLVWLSEIILQQTRVEHGMKYYLLFKKKFPTVKKLAAASEDTVLKLWEGLGYYSRARNLHSTAQTIVKNYKGKFPENYTDIRKLKGIGDYTAASIASYAFHLPYAVVDANVIRILTRIFGIDEPVHSLRTKNKITLLAQNLLPVKYPAQHNQAMMDFGALVCKPVSPDCPHCPFQKNCYAFAHNLTNVIPIKIKKKQRKKRYFHYLILSSGKNLFIRKRTSTDIWKNLFEFPLIEAEKSVHWDELKKMKAYKEMFRGMKISLIKQTENYTQQLTHQSIYARFIICTFSGASSLKRNGWTEINRKQIKDFAFPGIIRNNLPEVL